MSLGHIITSFLPLLIPSTGASHQNLQLPPKIDTAKPPMFSATPGTPIQPPIATPYTEDEMIFALQTMAMWQV
jgi:hypothetical protein